MERRGTKKFMTKDLKISASILCADFTKLGEEIKKCEDAGVDMFHVDVMDGHFVPNITIGPMLVEVIRSVTKLPIEAHLMIEHPTDFIDSFLKAGADIISIQAECYGALRPACREYGQYPKEVDAIFTDRVRADIKKIHDHRKKIFMVINPGTPLCIQSLYNEIDGVLMMSVNPGFAKQKFIPSVISKIQNLRQHFGGDIEVDGGINDLTAPEVIKAGANILATASYFFGSDNPKELVRELKSLGKD